MKCNQCEAAMINGVFCHEMGCPNTHAHYIDGEWVKMYECRECGEMVPADETCSCYDSYEEYDEEPDLGVSDDNWACGTLDVET